ncbi:odorant receptor 67c-like [Lasioglossum baleicum]|uniref:odorant receptor 67c-like n=1 Tax=Lasioglossum baleicum TaxID=434251 RepID=UPI003FCC7EF7
MHFRSESLTETVDNLSITLCFTLVFLKLILTWLNYGPFSEILSTMEEDCQKYAVVDVDNLIPKTGQVSYYLTTVIIYSYLVTAGFYMTGNLAVQDLNDTAHRKLYFRMDLPFEYHESPNYELIITLQFIFHLASGIVFGTTSALLLMAVFHAGCKIDILCQQLMEYSSEKENNIKVFIKGFQEVIKFTENIEKYFTFIAVSQLMSNTIVSCFKGFVIVSALSSEDTALILFQSIFYYAVICAEAFVYCYAGEYLRTKSKVLTDAAYGFLWYDLQPRESQLLILVILRSQKGFTLTFGKFSSLSLESFTSEKSRGHTTEDIIEVQG